ncbi:MAG TPA: lysophospholipid acyltransferase family protein [Acidimicrobiia bacterium]|nr:lysophospholipid acyltransferase family protein [Acidimicrobiia bacterium]
MYWIVKFVVTPFVRVFVRVRVEGRENVPRRGPVILASNHRSFLDSIFIPLVMRRRVTFVAKAEYFDDPKTAWFFRSCGQIPIRREGGSASERALESATEVLRSRNVFAIYPEGTRTRDGLMHRGHTGVARLALRCNVPIVPVGLVGTDEVQPVDSRLPKLFRRVTIRFGEPVDPDRYAGREHDRMALRELTDEVMYEIGQLSGYEYVDTYATKHAENIPTEAARIASYADARSPVSAAS